MAGVPMGICIPKFENHNIQHLMWIYMIYRPAQSGNPLKSLATWDLNKEMIYAQAMTTSNSWTTDQIPAFLVIIRGYYIWPSIQQFFYLNWNHSCLFLPE